MEAVTQINRKSLRAHTKLDTTMCPDGMSGRLRSRAQCPSLYHRSTLCLGHVADDHQALSTSTGASKFCLQKLTPQQVRHWNSDATSPPHVSTSKYSDLKRHHVLVPVLPNS